MVACNKKAGRACTVVEYVDQSPDELTIEWLCIDVDRHKIVNIYKPPPSRLTPQPSQCSLIYTSILVILIANIQTKDTTPSWRMLG